MIEFLTQMPTNAMIFLTTAEFGGSADSAETLTHTH
jgi:hypothetical protein